MRGIAVLVLIAVVVIPAFAGKPPVTQLVTIAQLEQAIASARGGSDGAAAKQLSEMRLTQRLSNARWAQLEEQLPGRQSREELLVLADEAAFLDLPAEDKLADPAPDGDTQTAILARTAAYVKDTMTELPSFSAQRSVTRFEGTATLLGRDLQDDLGTRVGAELLKSPSAQNWECADAPRLPTHRLDAIERASLPVIYRRGHALHAFTAGGEFACTEHGINTSDEFSEVHVLVPLVVGGGKAVWSHWESSAEGRLAVFRFSASVNYTATVTADERRVDLRGEIAVNPKDGALVRMVEIRRWEQNSIACEFDTAVEFGAVALSGKRLLLPVHRVAMFMTPILKAPTWDRTVESYYRKFHLEKSPLQEYLSDVHFGEYRPYNSPGEAAETASKALATSRR
jgi:hypothetical protein